MYPVHSNTPQSHQLTNLAVMSSQGEQQQWVRRPLGDITSVVVNSNAVNIKNHNEIVATKAISTVVQNVDISALCTGVENLSLRKLVKNTDPVLVQQKSNNGPSEVVLSYSSQVLEQVTDVDVQDTGLPLLVSEYVQDIYKHLSHLETLHIVPQDFLQRQKVSPWMRSTVIDWLIELQDGYNLLSETLYLTVGIMDRYLSIETLTSCNQLQCLAVTSMFIASKYEETQAPKLATFAYLTDGLVTHKDIIIMEIKVLNALNLYVSFPLPLHFLRRNFKVGDVCIEMFILANYLMELCLTEYSFSHVPASLQAAAALWFSMKLLDDQEWTANLAYYSGYSEVDLLPTMYRIAEVLRHSHISEYQAARTKYASADFMMISLIPHLKPEFVAGFLASIDQLHSIPV